MKIQHHRHIINFFNTIVFFSLVEITSVNFIMTEKYNGTFFDGSNENPVINMLKHISKHYEGDERTYIDKDGDEIVSSYRPLIVVHNASGFDSWVV